MNTDYNQQAADFLTRNGIKFRSVLSDTKRAPWQKMGCTDSHHYRVTLSKPGKRVAFDFWDSIQNRRDGIRELSAYSVLACISGDVHCPETFADFCSEYGYDTDSRSAEQTFRRCLAFSRKLRAFFTEKEIQELSEIQ